MLDNFVNTDGAIESGSCFWEDSPAGENKIYWEKYSGDGEGKEGEMP